MLVCARKRTAATLVGPGRQQERRRACVLTAKRKGGEETLPRRKRVSRRSESDKHSKETKKYEYRRGVRRLEVVDPKYQSRNVASFIGKLMVDGKKSLAERILYQAFALIEQRQKRPALEVFEQAIRNATPTVEVKPRRVGGSTYQVPVDVRKERGLSLAMRWLIRSARARTGKSMVEKLASEIMDAAAGQGATIKKREETHRMAESNKAFIHYRW
ncbi:MAG: 30S ribosomal protein S7 [Thermogemmatispora sp.]|jgi:small subunit ribosomal protein S7|nr:30S ribosomal protein S7 [Thermogemmatispora sp.]